jgi:putative copper resistance protein D
VEAGIGGKIQSLTEQPNALAQVVKWMTLVGKAVAGVVMIFFAIFWAVLGTQASVRPWHMLALGAICVFFLWSGAFQLYNFFDQEYTPGKFLTNPMLPDAESIAIGERLYQENCSGCHGPTGLGDGPAGGALFPPPANFTAGHTASHPDGDLFYWIHNGVKSTSMPAFGDQFTRPEIWHLVNYIRRLSAQSPQVTTQP